MIQPPEMRFARTSALGHMPGFAPPAPIVGPWRPIRLVSCDRPQIIAARLSTRPERDGGVIDVEVELASAPGSPLMVSCESDICALTPVGGMRHAATLRLPSVERWFPHTHGAPRLYEVAIVADGVTTSLGRVGFRSVEIDRGTEHFPALLRKCRTYEQYYASGREQAAHGTFGQVCWIVPTQARADRLRAAISSDRRLTDALFTVVTVDRAVGHLCGGDR
jgi:hypothetical protein